MPFPCAAPSHGLPLPQNFLIPFAQTETYLYPCLFLFLFLFKSKGKAWMFMQLSHPLY